MLLVVKKQKEGPIQRHLEEGKSGTWCGVKNGMAEHRASEKRRPITNPDISELDA